MINIQKYLERINFKEEIDTSLETLKRLQESHLISVPFENLDIHYGKEINLDIPEFYQKIVEEERGGFCYELNGLFYQLLKQIGYDVKLISARVYSNNGQYSDEFDHMAIVATVDRQNYLVDVGFGRFSFFPLPIIMERKIEDTMGEYYFDRFDKDYIRINLLNGDQIIPQYIFTTKSRQLKDFEERCRYQQTHPDSHFLQKKIISLPTKNGRITLNDDQLKITAGDSVYEINFDESKYEEYLFRYFGITISQMQDLEV